MGRGLSDLQKTILLCAYRNPHTIVSWGDLPDRVLFSVGTCDVVQMLDPVDDSRPRRPPHRRSVQAAVSRSMTGLIRRGLAKRGGGRRQGRRPDERTTGYYAGLLILTEEGAKLAEALSVNNASPVEVVNR
jgi:hypothetical protein